MTVFLTNLKLNFNRLRVYEASRTPNAHQGTTAPMPTEEMRLEEEFAVATNFGYGYFVSFCLNESFLRLSDIFRKRVGVDRLEVTEGII